MVRLALLVALLSLTVGCASQLDGPRTALAAVSAVYNEAAPRLEDRRRAEGLDCLARPRPADELCMGDVRQRWAPVRTAVEALYAALLSASTALHTAEAVEAMGRAVDMSTVMRLVLEAVAAVDALRAIAPPVAPAAPLPAAMGPPPPSPELRRTIQ